MEYAGSYALANYRFLKPSLGLGDEKTSLIRAFEHGLDRTSSEAGFVLIHVAMVRHSGGVVKGSCEALDAIENIDNDSNEERRAKFNGGMGQILASMKIINNVMEKMFEK